MGKSYWFASRPPDVNHRYTFLVFDCQDQLHFELTVFGKEAAARVEKKTVEGYLRALLPFFTYLEMDEWQVRAGQNWKRDPESTGVVEPRQRRKLRLSDSYFKLEDERWIPQVVDDPTLFARVLRGGSVI